MCLHKNSAKREQPAILCNDSRNYAEMIMRALIVIAPLTPAFAIRTLPKHAEIFRKCGVEDLESGIFLIFQSRV